MYFSTQVFKEVRHAILRLSDTLLDMQTELCNPLSFMDTSCLLCLAISSMLTVLINANMSA